jgi:hypothetical protein
MRARRVCNRRITWSAVASRSLFGLSAMNMRPLLIVVVPPPAPIAEPTDATAGSSSTALITAI